MSGPLLPLLLVFAHLTTALGFPTFAKPTARTTPCGCPIDTARPASCCCTTGTKVLTPGEPGSCCAKPKRKATAPLLAMLARGCHHNDGPLGLPAMEPAVPPAAGEAPVSVPVSDAVLASNATTVSRPAIPPDPPPRLIG